ncbi:hypothetical protein D3C75_1177020 [compost metagenome]
MHPVALAVAGFLRQDHPSVPFGSGNLQAVRPGQLRNNRKRGEVMMQVNQVLIHIIIKNHLNLIKAYRLRPYQLQPRLSLLRQRGGYPRVRAAIRTQITVRNGSGRIG